MDNTGYHKMEQKTTSHIDASKKVCVKCKADAVVIEDKTYYCAECMLIKQEYYYGMDKGKPKRKR